MTPIASMDGLPTSGGLAAAVEFQPDGLMFYDIATLTIDLAEPVPVEQQIPIGVSGAERNLELAFADVHDGSLRLQLLHFSSAGVAKGLLADLEPVRQRLGGDVEARLKSIAARELAYVRQRQLAGDENANLTPQFIEWYVQTFRENVLDPRLDAAEDSCAAGRLALLTYVEFQRTLQLLGAPQALEGMSQLVVDLIPLIAKQCITEEVRALPRRTHHPPHSPLDLGDRTADSAPRPGRGCDRSGDGRGSRPGRQVPALRARVSVDRDR